MTKSYIAEFMIQRKKGIYDLQKIVLDSFLRNFSIRNAIMNDACKPKKIKGGSPDKIEIFPAILRRIFTSGVLRAQLWLEIWFFQLTVMATTEICL